jgi:hypothetical protein
MWVKMPSSERLQLKPMAAEIKIPAPKAVKNNTYLSLNLKYLAMSAPAKDVPPANAQIAITRSISIMMMLGIVYVVGYLPEQLYVYLISKTSSCKLLLLL